MYRLARGLVFINWQAMRKKVAALPQGPYPNLRITDLRAILYDLWDGWYVKDDESEGCSNSGKQRPLHQMIKEICSAPCSNLSVH
jgi:hypothetical protein